MLLSLQCLTQTLDFAHTTRSSSNCIPHSHSPSTSEYAASVAPGIHQLSRTLKLYSHIVKSFKHYIHFYYIFYVSSISLAFFNFLEFFFSFPQKQECLQFCSGIVVMCLTAVREDQGSNPTKGSCMFSVKTTTTIYSLGLHTLTAVPM